MTTHSQISHTSSINHQLIVWETHFGALKQHTAYSIPMRSFKSLVYMLIFLNIKHSFFTCLLTSCATRLHKLAPVFNELILTLVSTMCSSMKSTLSSPLPLHFICGELITYGMYSCNHRTHPPLLPHPFPSVFSRHNSLPVFLAIPHLKFLTLPHAFHASHSDRSRPSCEPRIVHSLLVTYACIYRYVLSFILVHPSLPSTRLSPSSIT